MANKILTFSYYGQEVMRKEGFNSEMIYHGVDIDKFKPLSNRLELKAKRFGENKFVFGCVARNQPRKQLQYLVEAWKEFSKDKNDVMLYFHTDPTDPQAGFNLLEYIHLMGVEKTIAFPRASRNTGTYSFSSGVEIDELNEIYNSFDVHSVQTTGEGFGIPYIESMAAGIPNMTVDYTTPKELIGDRGWLVKSNMLIVGSYYTLRALPDVKDWVEKLNYVYSHREEIEQKRPKCLDFIKQFAWENIIPKWEGAINNAMNGIQGKVI
jgi:glycosyltransferase involved in cell wall biosynthesis